MRKFLVTVALLLAAAAVAMSLWIGLSNRHEHSAEGIEAVVPLAAESQHPTHDLVISDAMLVSERAEVAAASQNQPLEHKETSTELKPTDERPLLVRRIAKAKELFAANPADLDRAQELASKSILGWLTLEKKYDSVAEGVAAPLHSPDEDLHWIQQSGPFGTRSFSFSKSEFPVYWEILDLFRQPLGIQPETALPRVSSDLAERINELADLTLAKLGQ